MHPGPPMSFQGIMQPPLSAIPRGGSAGQIDEPTNGETEPGPNHEPPKKRRKWSHEDAVEGGSAPTTEPNGHSQPESNQAATPANRADTHLDASLMLDADEAATVVALLQQASGQAFSAHMSPPARLSDSPPHEAETLAQVTSAFIDDADVDADADADADADGEPDADGDADPDAEGEEVEAALELPTGSSSSYNAYITPSRQSPLDHILTEDGEPMLNPGESPNLTKK
ncbi:hypothetical protein EUX98_g3965 [Antrodiella citrinella]|uniref:Uncharacterized protein n=1 Tax=Antrodiella citrinella TaxID=2447956 RepID=A0A4S4MY36_9APHY|nr:hypothetical protein EUX98_g3965 [Antrodiella citrinella]